MKKPKATLPPPPPPEQPTIKQRRGLDWKTFWSILIPGTLTVIGWFMVNYFASKRDSDNKLREIKISYLIEDYRKLANATMRNPRDQQYYRDVEAAVSDIQLFGSLEQITALNYMIDNQKDLGHGSKGLDLDPLLNTFRTLLRKEIKLEKVEGNIRWFRFSLDNSNQRELDSTYKLIFDEQDKLLKKESQ